MNEYVLGRYRGMEEIRCCLVFTPCCPVLVFISELNVDGVGRCFCYLLAQGKAI